MTDSLAAVVGGLGRPRVLVVGDMILDKYVWGSVDRISPEAPIQVLDVTNEEYRPGGAGNVALNLARLDAEVSCLGVVGGDSESQILSGLLREAGVDTGLVFADPERPTTIKTRMIAHSQQVLRVDRERRMAIGTSVLPRILSALHEAIDGFDAILVSDYSKGLLAPELLRAVLDRARARDVPVLVDPKGTDFRKYRGAFLLTPNRGEAERVIGSSLEGDALGPLAERLRAELGLPALVVTLGKGGIGLFREGHDPLVVPARARQVYDVSGAGDTVLAVLGLCVASRVDLAESVRIANTAGGIVVGKVGTAHVTRRELVDEFLRPGDRHVKVLALPDLVRALDDERRQGRRIVFTNGCFDLLHPGHLSTFEFCRRKGDVVVVGINSDASVRRLKGPSRPILDQGERGRMLAGLADVDYVVVFDEDTPARLVEAVRPHVLVKGADWQGKEVVGSDVVEAEGGEVALCPLVPGLGTTDIIERIRQRFAP